MPTRNHGRHYCRHCEAEFQPSHGRHPSAHRLANAHLSLIHELPVTLQCDKYCQQAEQPEERASNQRRYGPGAAPLPPPLMTYDQLFPEES
jgi:hypothetical protein